MRIMKRPELAHTVSDFSEYGWDGWLGSYFANFAEKNRTILIMMQKVDAGTWQLTRKLRNVILTDLACNTQ